MSSTSTPWEQMASELENGMRQDLSGVRTRGAVRQREAVATTVRGAVRTRGARRGSIQPANEPPEPAPVVVVEVPENQPIPSAKKVKEKLGSQGTLDLYYVVHDKHWAALRPRELNPDDDKNGGDQHAFLYNLKPEFVLVASGEGRPSWCDDKTQVIEW